MHLLNIDLSSCSNDICQNILLNANRSDLNSLIRSSKKFKPSSWTLKLLREDYLQEKILKAHCEIINLLLTGRHIQMEKLRKSMKIVALEYIKEFGITKIVLSALLLFSRYEDIKIDINRGRNLVKELIHQYKGVFSEKTTNVLIKRNGEMLIGRGEEWNRIKIRIISPEKDFLEELDNLGCDIFYCAYYLARYNDYIQIVAKMFKEIFCNFQKYYESLYFIPECLFSSLDSVFASKEVPQEDKIYLYNCLLKDEVAFAFRFVINYKLFVKNNVQYMS
jgi:hypothetical protein